MARQRNGSRAPWLFAFIATLTTAAIVHAAGDPSVRWRTIETAHFLIHYDERSEELARRLAVLAEETYDQIVPVFGRTTSQRTHVAVINSVDTANGSASVVPFNMIRVYDMAPPHDSTLGDSDDWLRLLFLHEYIHILHMNDVSGIWTAVNALLGKTIVPNQALPRWYIEGLATYGESTFTEGGRLRNNAYRMYLRMDALSGRFRDVERWGGVPVEWPGGTGWYLYGSDFVDDVVDDYGLEAWLDFNGRIGGALSPWSVNQTSREVFGVDMLELWDRYVTGAQAEFWAEAVSVAARGETEVVRLTNDGFFSGNPRCRDAHSVGYLSDSGHDRRAIVSTSLIDGETEHWVDVYGGGSFDWLPDGDGLVYTQGARYENFYAYNDLFLYDRPRDTVTRLTHGERAREPAVSPDGRHVAFVSANLAGGVDLRELDRFTGEIRYLYESSHYELAATPDYSPDGRTIAFSLWRLDWSRDIFVLDRETGALEQLTHDRARDLEPSFTPDGASILFSSDRTGIFNAYAFDLETREVRQLTNVVSGVFSPYQCVPDGPLFARVYGPIGYDVGMVNEVDPRPAQASYERADIDYPERTEEDVILEEHRYRPWRELYPRNWSPVLSEDSEGFVVGATIDAYDPMGLHYYTASLTYGTASDRINGGVYYTYARLPFDINLFANRLERTVARRLVAETRYIPFEEEEISAGVSLNLPLWDERSSHSLYLSYAFRKIRMLDLPDIDHDPGDVQPVFPEDGRYDDVSLGWFWGEAHGYAYSLSLEEGTLLNVFLTLRSPITGADFEAVILSWALRQYFPMPWLEDHVVALLLTGGIGRAPQNRRPLFSVGGFPEQDIVLALIDQTPMGSGFLRGYPQHVQVGSQFHLANLEYRLPLWIVDTGAWTLPFFIERIYLAAFADAGTALDEWDGFSTILVGAGVELRMQTTIGFIVPASFRLGYARGFMEDGINDFYIFYGGTF